MLLPLFATDNMTTPVKPFVIPPIRACSHPTLFPLNVSKQLSLAISSSVAPNKPSTYYEYLVSIAVGKEQKVFRIRKGLLGYHSSCLRETLNGNFKGSRMEVV